VNDGSWRVIDRLVNAFDRLLAGVAYAGAVIAALAALAILTLVCTEVFLRELLDQSTLIADEMSGYLNVAIVYLGLAYTLREGGFIRVEAIYNRLADKAGRIVPWFIVLASLTYVGILFWFMVEHVTYSFRSDIRSMFVSQTPLYLPQLLIPIGLGILALQFLAFALKRVRELP
jgi:TRAP-type C4-dicarboxylate transport system permease small subunit